MEKIKFSSKRSFLGRLCAAIKFLPVG